MRCKHKYLGLHSQPMPTLKRKPSHTTPMKMSASISVPWIPEYIPLTMGVAIPHNRVPQAKSSVVDRDAEAKSA